jgi:hypothetical protein
MGKILAGSEAKLRRSTKKRRWVAGDDHPPEKYAAGAYALRAK